MGIIRTELGNHSQAYYNNPIRPFHFSPFYKDKRPKKAKVMINVIIEAVNGIPYAEWGIIVCKIIK